MIRRLAALASYLDIRGHLRMADSIDSILRKMAGDDLSPPFSREESAIIADAIGLDFSAEKFQLEDFQSGLSVELEHGSRDPETDVIHDNYLSAGKIAWAHLKEDPAYYTKLAKIEK